MEEMKPVVAVNDDFACRDKSKVIAYFGIFGLSRLCCEEKFNGLICQWIYTSFKFLGRDQDGKYQASSYGELADSISR